MELVYARVLRATGANAEAAQKEAEVSARLDALRRQQCNGCSISAAGFRYARGLLRPQDSPEDHPLLQVIVIPLR